MGILLLWFFLRPVERSSSHVVENYLVAATAQKYTAFGKFDSTPLSAPNLRYVRKRLSESRKGQDPVRVLFYGQSITEQGWWTRVADFLKAAYPNAEIYIENRAIGGHASNLLVKTAEVDVYPFQPDLVIFHVYGSDKSYEKIIRRIREQTIADVIIATDHITLDGDLAEETRSAQLSIRKWLYKLYRFSPEELRNAQWRAWFNNSFLQEIARSYNIQIANVRDQWKAYLQVNNLRASDLLTDDVHLNAHGQYLMAEIIQRYLGPASASPSDSESDDRVRDISRAQINAFVGNNLQLEFVGTRIDVILSGNASKIESKVDSISPCGMREAYRFGRATFYPGSNWPTLLQVQRGPTDLISETWFAIISDADSKMEYFKFEVHGSASGFDGRGDSTHRFQSVSGRVIIDPEDWNLSYGRSVIKSPVPNGFKISWRADCLGSDIIAFNRPQMGTAVTVVQGLTNSEHNLHIPKRSLQEISGIRIFRPLFGRESRRIAELW